MMALDELEFENNSAMLSARSSTSKASSRVDPANKFIQFLTYAVKDGEQRGKILERLTTLPDETIFSGDAMSVLNDISEQTGLLDAMKEQSLKKPVSDKSASKGSAITLARRLFFHKLEEDLKEHRKDSSVLVFEVDIPEIVLTESTADQLISYNDKLVKSEAGLNKATLIVHFRRGQLYLHCTRNLVHGKAKEFCTEYLRQTPQSVNNHIRFYQSAVRFPLILNVTATFWDLMTYLPAITARAKDDISFCNLLSSVSVTLFIPE